MAKRCQLEGCNKKLKLTNFPCRCEKTFCDSHRLDHHCQYDYKKDKIKLVKVVREKVIKI